ILLTADCISSLVLVSLSFRLLWGVKLPAKERMMILAMFSTSAFVTLVYIFCATCQYISGVS
ncbi:hypothetical protein K503DRAFT_685103, partial [Rhizopogon vinicolor AM-OR11-026]